MTSDPEEMVAIDVFTWDGDVEEGEIRRRHVVKPQSWTQREAIVGKTGERREYIHEILWGN